METVDIEKEIEDLTKESNMENMSGKCAKLTTVAIIVANGVVVGRGTNACRTPQETCPREGLPTGVGYEKCKEICGQEHHAEVAACLDAGEKVRGGTLYLFGHYYACQNCLDVMESHGVTLCILNQS